MSTVRDLFLDAVNNFSNNTAVVEEENRITYTELGSMVDRLSSYLCRIGVKKGDPVIVLLPNSIEYVAAFFAITNIGAVCVPVNSAYKKQEIEYYVIHCSAKLVLTDERLLTTAQEVVSGTRTSVSVIKGSGSDWNTLPVDVESLRNISIDPSDEAIYLYSTGSTGKPKRVSRTHLNLVALADNHTHTVGWTERDRILFAVPMSHTYAFGNFISSVKIGASIYVVAEFNRSQVLDVIEKESITVFPSVPVMLDVLAKTYLPEPKDLSSLKLVISAGAPLSEKTFHSFFEKYGIYPRQLYGSSETGVISINLGSDIERTFNSVGRAVKNVVVKIFDDDGVELGAGEAGEIAVRSPSMTNSGYFGMPEETKEVFKDGYYFTGDLGKIDAEGFIYIVGRKKLFINISGNKVDPLEVENILLEHEKIKDAVVLGILDDNGIEAVKAAIVPDGELQRNEVVQYCRERISGFKIPSVIEFLDELPRSPTGKVLREELK